MPAIESQLDSHSASFAANRDAMLNQAEAQVLMAKLQPSQSASLRSLALERLLTANAITPAAGVNAGLLQSLR